MNDAQTIKEQGERIEALEEQLGLLVDLLEASNFRERIEALEKWITDWEESCDIMEQELAGMEIQIVPDRELVDAIETANRDKKRDH